MYGLKFLENVKCVLSTFMEPSSLSHKIWKNWKREKPQILYLKVSVYASSADLLTLYATTPGNATMEATDDMLTRRPFDSRRRGRKAFVIIIAPYKLTFRVLSKCSLVCHSNGAAMCKTPALLTTAHRTATKKRVNKGLMKNRTNHEKKEFCFISDIHDKIYSIVCDFIISW